MRHELERAKFTEELLKAKQEMYLKKRNRSLYKTLPPISLLNFNNGKVEERPYEIYQKHVFNPKKTMSF